MAKRTRKDRIGIEVLNTFKAPVYREVNGSLTGPLTRTFRAGDVVKATKLTETRGNLNVNLGRGYMSFNIPTSAVSIFR
jgi:hypothetical protein